MIFNLIVIFFTLILGNIYSKLYGSFANSDVIRKRYIRIICIILILQSGLRNVAVGDDTYSYFETFKEISRTPWYQIKGLIIDYYQYGLGKDPGYLIFQKLAQYITTDYQVFLFLIAILFFAALGNFIYKNTTRLVDVMIAFVIYSVLFYSFYSITGIRQTLATVFTLYSYEFVKKKKIIPFLLLVLIASTLHKSALIFIPFYFVCRIKKEKYIFTAVLLLFPVFFVFKDAMGKYLSVLSGYTDYNQLEGAGTYTFTALFVFISLMAMIRRKYIIKNNINAKNYYNGFAIALVFLPLSYINPNALRIIMYFSIFMILFIPEIIYSLKYISNKMRIDVSVITIILLISLFIKSNFNSEMPYGFFWEEMRLTKQYYNRD
ncbi:EpsG family protein [Flavobacterium sp.]|uniref:EpsG family protein n=1 Tax=Flavobacterium sp. TaxID=239 RepID=UPI0038FD1805